MKELSTFVRHALNDLKRTAENIEDDLCLKRGAIYEMDDNELIEIICKKYPIACKHIRKDNDTSIDGIWYMSNDETKKSQRVISRTGSDQIKRDYYCYMDTAMSSIAPFKPELIEELVAVNDNNAYNPVVVMNHGHLLSQFTYFIGPVNFYYTVRNKRHCFEANTGDSCFIHPYVPHSFTSRDMIHPANAKIVAVTFSSSAKDVLAELSALDPASLIKCCGDKRDSSANTQRILRHAELNPNDPPILLSELSPLLKENEEVIIQKRSLSLHKESAHLPYIVTLAKSIHFPEARAFEYSIQNEGTYMYSQFYQYIFNVHTEITIRIENNNNNGGNLNLNQEQHIILLEPGASMVVKPFTKIVATTEKVRGCLYVVKLPGPLTDKVIAEISLFAPKGRDSMLSSTNQWF